MATNINKRRSKKSKTKPELDGVYFLKIVLYLLVGAQWVWLTDGAGTVKVPLPVGLVVGIIFASHEHFRLDRKVEYAVLLIAMLVGFATQYGIYIST